jgi:hypothetical protein
MKTTATARSLEQQAGDQRERQAATESGRDSAAAGLEERPADAGARCAKRQPNPDLAPTFLDETTRWERSKVSTRGQAGGHPVWN